MSAKESFDVIAVVGDEDAKDKEESGHWKVNGQGYGQLDWPREGGRR